MIEPASSSTAGSGGAAFFVIEAGEAAVFIGGKQRTTLKSGDYFGEIALIDEGTRMATITASSERQFIRSAYFSLLRSSLPAGIRR
jgi:CRP-like cAMP-binding protein